jgi:hypothetical protein
MKKNTLHILLEILTSLIAICAVADAQDNRASSDIGLCAPNYNYGKFISQFQHVQVIRTHFLLKTFNPNGCPNAVKLMNEPATDRALVSVWNGPGERNRRLQPYEYGSTALVAKPRLTSSSLKRIPGR